MCHLTLLSHISWLICLPATFVVNLNKVQKIKFTRRVKGKTNNNMTVLYCFPEWFLCQKPEVIPLPTFRNDFCLRVVGFESLCNDEWSCSDSPGHGKNFKCWLFLGGYVNDSFQSLHCDNLRGTLARTNFGVPIFVTFT